MEGKPGQGICDSQGREEAVVSGVRYPREARLQTDHWDVITRSLGFLARAWWVVPSGIGWGNDWEAREFAQVESSLV